MPQRPHLFRKESKKGIPSFTLSEIAQHDRNDDLWMIIHDKVYNVTKIIDDHPGGAEVLFEYGGLDASEPFDDVGHSQDSVDMLKPLFIGLVKQDKININDVDKDDLNNNYYDNNGYDDERENVQNLSLGESLYLKNKRRKKGVLKNFIDKYSTQLLMIFAIIMGILYIIIEKRKWRDDE